MTELCELAYRHAADKCPQFGHPYTPYYYDLFKDIRNDVKKVFEMGVGGYDRKFLWRNPQYKPGASLRMWRDFFPNAQVYGGDILLEGLIEEERIKTYICDETNKKWVQNLLNMIGDIDIFIDDASHNLQHQIELAKYAMPVLPKNVIYIIEDVTYADAIKVSLPQYDCDIPILKGRRLQGHKIVRVKK